MVDRTVTHWAAQYIGRPWALGAAGPGAFDCWNFVQHVQRMHYHRSMPDVEYDGTLLRGAYLLRDTKARGQWVSVDKPEDGDCVLMARHIRPIHIGVWLEASNVKGVLHCVQGLGVVYQTQQELLVHGWTTSEYARLIHA